MCVPGANASDQGEVAKAWEEQKEKKKKKKKKN